MKIKGLVKQNALLTSRYHCLIINAIADVTYITQKIIRYVIVVRFIVVNIVSGVAWL